MAQNIDPSITKLLEEAYKDLAASVGYKGWHYADLKAVSDEELKAFIKKIGGESEIRWLAASRTSDGKTRGQVLISPEGREKCLAI